MRTFGEVTGTPRGFRSVSSSPAQVSARADWHERATLREQVRRLNSGTRIQVDPKINELVIDLMEQVAPLFAAAFNRRLVPWARQVFDEWPVRTGYSRSLLALEFEPLRPGEFAGRVVDRAPYAAQIRKGQLQRWLFAGIDQVADQVTADVAGGIR